MGMLDQPTGPRSWTETAPAASILALLASGSIAGIAAPVLLRQARGALATLALSLAYLSLITFSGAAVARWRRAPTSPSLLAACAWLAPIALLVASRSWWALPAAAVLGALAAAAFRALPRQDSPVDDSESAKAFLLLPETPPASRRRALGVKLATALAYCGGTLALVGDLSVAALLVGAACAIVAWFSLTGSSAHAKAKVGFALAATILALLPGTWLGLGRYPPPAQEGDGESDSKPKRQGLHAGVILLTDAKFEPPLLAPPAPRLPNLNPAKPVTLASIRFSGEYWYFFWPLRRPGEDALRRLGDPATLAYTAVDGSSIIMQARQPLPEPIDLRCCQAIDVVLRNQEPRPETVYVELALIDSSQEREVPMSLGVQELAAALRFDVPSQPELRTFDALLVWFHLDESRQQRSPNLAIERFDLIR